MYQSPIPFDIDGQRYQTQLPAPPAGQPLSAPVQTLKTFATTSGNWDWRNDNDLVLESGLKGPIFGIHYRVAGKVIIKNPTQSSTFVYKTVTSSGKSGPWFGNPQDHILAPGNQVSYEASWDGTTAFHVFNFSVRDAEPGDSKGSEGAPHTQWDDAKEWVGRNWIPITAVVVGTVVTVKFVGPGVKSRLSGEYRKEKK